MPTAKKPDKARSTKPTTGKTPKAAAVKKKSAATKRTATKSTATKTVRKKSTASTKATTKSAKSKPATKKTSTRQRKTTKPATPTSTASKQSDTVVLPTRMSIRAREKALVLMDAFEKDFYLPAIKVTTISGLCFLLVGSTYSLYSLGAKTDVDCGPACTASLLTSASGTTVQYIEPTVDSVVEPANTVTQADQHVFEQLGDLPSTLADEVVVRMTASPARSVTGFLQYVSADGKKERIPSPVERLGNDRFSLVIDATVLPSRTYTAKVKVVYIDGEEVLYTLGSFTTESAAIKNTKADLPPSDQVIVGSPTTTVTTSKETADTVVDYGASVEQSATGTQSTMSLEPAAIETSTSLVLEVERTLSKLGVVRVTYSKDVERVRVYLRNIATLVAQPIDTPLLDGKLAFSTTDVPNGEYAIYAIGSTNEGEQVRSETLLVTIKNEVKRQDTSTTQAAVERDLFAVETDIPEVREVAEVDSKEPSSETREVNEVGEVIIADEREVVATDTPALPLDGAETTQLETSREPVLSAEEFVSRQLRTDKDQLQEVFTTYAVAEQAGSAQLLAIAQVAITDYRAEVVSGVLQDQSLAKIADEIDELLAKRLQNMQNRVVAFEQIRRDRTEADSAVDTDGDGIADVDEIALYRTDPQNPDSDNDGFTDGVEIMRGFDPKEAAAETIINYESPKETVGVVTQDKLEVAAVVPDIVLATETSPERVQTVVRGRGLPNSFVTLYVFSTPTIVTVRTDADGVFEYTFSKELEDGEHQVFAAVTDNTGAIVAQSEPFTFVKRARAFTPVDGTNQETVALVSVPADNDAYQVAIGMSILALGILLILLGVGLRTNEPELSPAT